MINGGTESFLMNYFRRMNHDLLQIDFVVHGDDEGVFDDEIISYGSKIYHVPVRSRNYFGNVKALTEIFSTGKYSVVHAHMNSMNTAVLKIAKKCGIPCRISHAHSTDHQIFGNTLSNVAKRILGEYARVQSAEYATHMFSCSCASGTWLFGDYNMDRGAVTVLPNAIDVDKFAFSRVSREKMRAELDIESDFVVGHVGRFDPSKNQSFLVDVFEQIAVDVPKSKLLLVGDGMDRTVLTEKIIQKKLNDKVIFTGSQNDISGYLHAMDVFVLPSKFEGLGISLIEAQAAGLACVASTDVPIQADVTGNVRFVDLNKGVETWAKAITDFRVPCHSEIAIQRVKANGYDINDQWKFLQNFYLEHGQIY